MKTLNLMKTGLFVFLTVMFFNIDGLLNTANAQRGPGNGPGYGQGPNRGACYSDIPDLTDEQKQKIDNLREKHQEEMAVLRVQRRNADTPDERDDIAIQMIEKRKAHRNEVRNLLTDEQKEVFDENVQNMRPGGPHGQGQGYGRGQGRRGGCRGGRW